MLWEGLTVGVHFGFWYGGEREREPQEDEEEERERERESQDNSVNARFR